MFEHRLSDNPSRKTWFEWFLLAFLAGNVNVGGWMACHRFVSHVTGFATLAGVAAEERAWIEMGGALAIPFFFLAGVVIAALITESDRYARGYRYGPVMLLVAGLLLFVSWAGHTGYFGTFGWEARMEHDFILLAALCGACGLQNAAITSASGATVRTTHLTGITTDLGLGIVRWWRKHQRHAEDEAAEARGTFLRIGTILSFTVGGFVGAFVYAKFEYAGFLLPTMLAVYSATSATVDSRAAKRLR